VKCGLTLFAIASAALPFSAEAAEIVSPGDIANPNADSFANDSGPMLVTDDVLAEQRGGFVINGMTVKLGADVRTYINGELALHTTINWSDTGITKSQIVGSQLSPAEALTLDANALANGQITMAVGGTPAFTANDGQTLVAHRFEDGLQNILVNSASNQNIQQMVNASIELGGYDSFRSTIISASMADALSASIGAMSFN
jgi:hypothetical protein